jgi:hypothetical protein
MLWIVSICTVLIVVSVFTAVKAGGSPRLVPALALARLARSGAPHRRPRASLPQPWEGGYLNLLGVGSDGPRPRRTVL